MTITQMLGQSAILTLLGMAVVFSFLVIMILCMGLLHKVLHALKLDKEEPKNAPVTSAVPADKGAVVAAIATALHDKI